MKYSRRNTFKHKPHSKIKTFKSGLRLNTHNDRILKKKLRKYVKYGGQAQEVGVIEFDDICRKVSIQNIRQKNSVDYFESTILNDLLHDKALPSFFQDIVTHNSDDDKMVKDSVKKNNGGLATDSQILDVFQDQYDIIGKHTIQGQYKSNEHIYIKDSFSGKYAMGFSNFIDSAKTSTLVYLETMHKMQASQDFVDGIPNFAHTQSIYMDKFYCYYILNENIDKINESERQKELHVKCLNHFWQHCCLYIKRQMEEDPELSNYSGIKKEKINDFMTGIKFVGFEIDAKASKKYQTNESINGRTIRKGINIYKYPTVEFPNVTGRVPFEISQSACASYIRKLGDNPYKYCAQRNEKQNNIVVACFDGMLKSLHAMFDDDESMQKRFCISLMKYIGDTSHIVLGLLYNYAQEQRRRALPAPPAVGPEAAQAAATTPRTPPPAAAAPQLSTGGARAAAVTPGNGVPERQPGSGQPGRQVQQRLFSEVPDIDFNKKSMVLIEERPLFIRLVQNDVNFISEPQKVLKEKVPISSGELYISQDNTQDKELKKINRKYNCWNFLYIILNSYPAIFGLRGYIIKYRDDISNDQSGVNKNTIKVLLESIPNNTSEKIDDQSLIFDVYNENSIEFTSQRETEYDIELDKKKLGKEEIRIYKFYKSYISYSRLLNSFEVFREAEQRNGIFLKRVKQAVNIIIKEFPASFMNSSRRTCRVCKIAGNTYYNLFLRASKQTFMSSIHFILNDIIIPYIETFEMSEELFYDRLKVIVNDIIEDLVCRKFKFEANDEQGFAEQFSSSIDNNLARNGNIRISDTENIQLLAKFMTNANKLKELIEKKQGRSDLVDYDQLHECVFLTEPNMIKNLTGPTGSSGGGGMHSEDELASASSSSSENIGPAAAAMDEDKSSSKNIGPAVAMDQGKNHQKDLEMQIMKCLSAMMMLMINSISF